MTVCRVSVFVLVGVLFLCGCIDGRKLVSEKEVHAVGESKSFFPYIPGYGAGSHGGGFGGGYGGGFGGGSGMP
uniref:Glycine-rich protein n=1 Tax=Gossypium raimondii TaxID=29730 RepID=A0A0D2TLR3_GOSRA|nr:hypothetical protein B456_009G179700 [Gossypium raimondii]